MSPLSLLSSSVNLSPLVLLTSSVNLSGCWGCWWAYWWPITALTFGPHFGQVLQASGKQLIFSSIKPLIKGLPGQSSGCTYVNVKASGKAPKSGLQIGVVVGLVHGK